MTNTGEIELLAQQIKHLHTVTELGLNGLAGQMKAISSSMEQKVSAEIRRVETEISGVNATLEAEIRAVNLTVEPIAEIAREAKADAAENEKKIREVEIKQDRLTGLSALWAAIVGGASLFMGSK